MTEVTELAKYGPWGAVIACLIVMVIIIKHFIDKFGVERKEFLEFAEQMMKSSGARQEKLRLTIDKNTRVNQQVYDFLKNLNGGLKKAIENKIK